MRDRVNEEGRIERASEAPLTSRHVGWCLMCRGRLIEELRVTARRGALGFTTHTRIACACRQHVPRGED